METNLQTLNINALPGNPSTFWSKDGIYWYTTKKNAEENNKNFAVDPTKYAIPKPFWVRNKKYIIIAIIVIAIAALGFYGYQKGWFNKLIK